MRTKWVKLFLRLTLAIGFLSAVADRFGIWTADVSAWGNWDNFLDYTQTINPWVPEIFIPILGGFATVAEVVLGICLLIGYRTELIAQLSGWLLLLFALSMAFSLGIKAPFDYSVFAAAAAAFALSLIKEKHWEVDALNG